jgi:twinkle protein
MKSWSDLGIDVRGKSSGEIKTVCPQCSHTRKKRSYPCLNVNIDKGMYNCWHCGWSGSIGKGNYMKPYASGTKNYRKPEFKAQLLTENGMSYLAERGITPEVAARNQISMMKKYMPQREEEVMCIAFPFIKHGEIVNVKYRDKNKYFTQEGGAEKTWYKYDDIDPKCTIITEGEFDALALEVAGFRHSISVPDGAPTGNATNFEKKFSYLDVEDPSIESVEKFILAVDNDVPGRKLEEELARRLGKERCYRVQWPEDCKDANDVLVKLGKEVLSDCIKNAIPFPVDGIFELDAFGNDLDQIYTEGLPPGLTTGWANVDDFYRPMEGQWTLVTGVPGMGKSEWLDALAMNMTRMHHWVIGVCSPENQPITYHAAKLMEKYAGKRLHKMTKEEYEEAKEWVGVFFKFVMPEDRTLDSLLAKAKLMVKRYGMKGLIIDPYNEITHTHRKDGISETEYISDFLAQLRGFARMMGIHIWLVAHPTKLQKGMDGKYPVPTGYDVAGSAHFFNKADNIIAIHRDKGDPMAYSEVHVQKIRSRWLGQLGHTFLEWDKSSGRFSIPAGQGSGFLR